MQFVPYLGMGSFVLVSLLVGIGLLVRAARSGAGDEAAIGAGLVLAGGFGPLLATAAGAVAGSRPGESEWLWSGGLLAMNLGACALYLFTWRVFRAASPLAAAFALAGIVAMFVGFAGSAATTGMGRIGLHDAWAYLGFAGRWGSFAWASWTSFAHYRAGSRRLQLGLAEPLVVNRFLLWSLGSGAAVVVLTINLVRNLRGDFDPAGALALTVTPAFGMVAAVAIALAFFPPAPYRRRFETA